MRSLLFATLVMFLLMWWLWPLSATSVSFLYAVCIAVSRYVIQPAVLWILSFKGDTK